MTYNPYLLRFELDALTARASYHEQRGRNLASFRAHLDTAEAQLARRPRFPWSRPQSSLKKAHRSGNAALRSLTAARVGRPVAEAVGAPTLAQASLRRRTQCDVCGAGEATLKFCNDYFCVTCYINEAVTMRHASAYWSAPDDATFDTFDVDAAYVQARNAAAAIPSGDVQAAAQANQALTGALRSLFAVAEAYPDLKANQNFLELQQALQNIEGDLGNARRYYNATVRDYNTSIQQFPGVILANMTGFKQREFFELEDKAEAKNIEVKF